MTIPTYVHISEASRRTGADPVQISRLAASGVIKAARLSDGSIIVDMEDLSEVVKRVTKRESFSNLDGIPIHLSEAARKYNLPATSISGWRKAGHIRTLGKEKNRILLNEADIAYIKAVIDSVGLRPGQDLTKYL